ncbi:hypothetical protein [Nitrosophilus kaiyonis]|uniref:hypothetical protein n=1 Tax=Nitrosophilus kaiyonis TaxID=2930200 RepID=UPI002490A07D|nr:hypothetical protein [Nitrosophilus kaiyonis]
MLDLTDFSFAVDYKRDFRLQIREVIRENEHYEENGEVIQDGLSKMEMLEIFLDELDIDGKDEILNFARKYQLEEEFKRIRAHLAYKG